MFLPDQNYPSPTSSLNSPLQTPHLQLDQYSSHTQQSSLPHPHMQDNRIFSQVESSIGPTRQTRGQSSLLQGPLGERRLSVSRPYLASKRDNSPGRQPSMELGPHSRPQTPAHISYDRVDEGLSVNTGNAHPVQLQSPYLTPQSTTSRFSPYVRQTHSRSASGSTIALEPRQPSPALSSGSGLTSSSGTSHRFGAPTAESSKGKCATLPNGGVTKPKHRKQRLRDRDRKDICLYHLEHPNARQEDIAEHFQVERSTVSKILKGKEKWLNAEDGLDRAAKNRPSKFPEIEEVMRQWLQECTNNDTNISDLLIRTTALDTAQKLHIPEERFKASSGWIENFKHRHEVRGGKWVKGEKMIAANRNDNPGALPSGPCAVPLPKHSYNEPMGDLPSHISPDNEFVPRRSTESEAPTHDQQMAPQNHWPEPSHDEMHHAAASNASAMMHEAAPHQSPLVGQQVPTAQVNDDVYEHHHPVQEHHHPIQEHHHPVQEHLPVQEQIVYSNGVYDAGDRVIFTPMAPAPNPPPSMNEAEEAVNTLILFLDTVGSGIIQPHERQVLATIKCALFQAASGVPFDRTG